MLKIKNKIILGLAGIAMLVSSNAMAGPRPTMKYPYWGKTITTNQPQVRFERTNVKTASWFGLYDSINGWGKRKWYRASSICKGNTCTIAKYHLKIPNGSNRRIYVYPYIPGTSVSSGMTQFNIASRPTNTTYYVTMKYPYWGKTITTNQPQVRFDKTHASNASWFIAYDSINGWGKRKWYRASSICKGNTCTIPKYHNILTNGSNRRIYVYPYIFGKKVTTKYTQFPVLGGPKPPKTGSSVNDFIIISPNNFRKGINIFENGHPKVAWYHKQVLNFKQVRWRIVENNNITPWVNIAALCKELKPGERKTFPGSSSPERTMSCWGNYPKLFTSAERGRTLHIQMQGREYSTSSPGVWSTSKPIYIEKDRQGPLVKTNQKVKVTLPINNSHITSNPLVKWTNTLANNYRIRVWNTNGWATVFEKVYLNEEVCEGTSCSVRVKMPNGRFVVRVHAVSGVDGGSLWSEPIYVNKNGNVATSTTPWLKDLDLVNLIGTGSTVTTGYNTHSTKPVGKTQWIYPKPNDIITKDKPILVWEQTPNAEATYINILYNKSKYKEFNFKALRVNNAKHCKVRQGIPGYSGKICAIKLNQAVPSFVWGFYTHDYNSKGWATSAHQLVNIRGNRPSTMPNSTELKGYSCAWNDEFYGNVINKKVWTPYYSGYFKGAYHPPEPSCNANDGKGQCLARYPKVSGGVLHLSNEIVNVPRVNQNGVAIGGTAKVFTYDHIISGKVAFNRLRKHLGPNDGFEKKYGYFEARMKFSAPEILGPQSSFWLLSDHIADFFARKGKEDINHDGMEMDVIETIPTGTREVHHNSHYNGWPTGKAPMTFGAVYREQARWHSLDDSKSIYDGKFHTFGVRWTANSIRYYIDGKLSYSKTAHLKEVPVTVNGTTKYMVKTQPFSTNRNLKKGNAGVGKTPAQLRTIQDWTYDVVTPAISTDQWVTSQFEHLRLSNEIGTWGSGNFGCGSPNDFGRPSDKLSYKIQKWTECQLPFMNNAPVKSEVLVDYVRVYNIQPDGVGNCTTKLDDYRND